MIDPKVQELILDFLVDEKAFWQKDSTYDTTKFVEPKLSDAHTRLYFEEADDQAKSLSELVPPSLPHPNRAGKTMILKGPAGAGKSFALCALALAAIERMEKALRDGEPPGWLPWRLDSADQLDDIVGQLEACCKNRSLVNDRDLVLQLIKTVPIVIMIDNLHEKVANHAKLPVLNRHFHWLLTARPGYALDIANAEIHALAGFGVAQRSALLDRFQIQGTRREQLLHWATGRDLLQLVRVPQLWSMALELDQTTDLAAIASETDLYRTFVDQLVEKHIDADDRKLATALLGLMGLACLSSKTVPREQVLSWLESYQQHRRGDPNHYRGLLNDFPRLLHPVQTEDQQTLAFVHANLAIYLGATQLHKLYHLWDQIPLNDEGLGLRLFLLELSCHGPQAKEDAQARAVAHLSTVIDHLLRRGRMAALAVWLVRFGEHLLCHGIAHLKARQKEINGSDLKLLRACLRRRDPQLVQLLSHDLKGKARRQAMGLETQSKRNRDKEQRAQQKKLAERQRERLTMDARLWEELRNSKDSRRRVALVDALALEGKPGTAAQLKPYLTSPDKYLRGAVTRALGLPGRDRPGGGPGQALAGPGTGCDQRGDHGSGPVGSCVGPAAAESVPRRR